LPSSLVKSSFRKENLMNKNLHVEGMTCGHCVETVTKAVNSLAGIKKITVDLDQKQVSVDFDESQTDVGAISSKIIEVGFEVIEN